METLKQVIMGTEEEEELNRGGGTGEKVRKEMLCSGGLERILYALSVTCRSVLIIERGKVRAERKVSIFVCVCVCEFVETHGVEPQRCLRSIRSAEADDEK